MKVLWLCNMMLPMAAKKLNRPSSNKEGWLTGLVERILADEEFDATIAVAFPADRELAGCKGVISDKMRYYAFYEDTGHPEKYDAALEEQLREIVRDFQPDLVHCFGAEFPHTLAMCKVFEQKDRILVGMQGICSRIAQAYYASLPESVVKRKTVRDILRQDSLTQQKEKFRKRGLHETEALLLTGNVAGRTAWDKEHAKSVNPNARYFELKETLRSVFYEKQWEEDNCRKHSLFLCQGDYPLKGLHYVLEALAKLKKTYPDACLTVAGNPIVRDKTFKGNLKISGYGLYIRKAIDRLGLSESVTFTGSISAQELRGKMLESNVFVCASALENSPNSLGEAMLLGMPCVTSYVGGIPSLFDEGEDGLVFDGYREGADGEEEIDRISDSLAKAVKTLFEMGDEKRKMTETARKHAETTHNPEENGRKLKEMYAKIVNGE